MLRRTMILWALLIVMAGSVSAQQVPDATLMSMRAEVSVEGSGGTQLRGDFYAADMNTPTPAVLLLHMARRDRGDWQPFIDPLLNGGYSVLAVDLRAHGESEGTLDWATGQQDVTVWIDWLTVQPFVDPDHIAVIGASIGANYALNVCAMDSRCDSVIALSPGLNYFNIMTEPAMEGLADRAVLLVAAHLDAPSGNDVIELVSAAQGEVGLQLYSGRGHGTDLFEDEQSGAADTLIPLMLLWLDGHVGGE